MTSPSVPPDNPATPALRILVIEDNLDVAESLRIFLELGGHRVAVAHDGDAALTAARLLLPNIVLCDISLPGDMDGYAIARALKSDASHPRSYLVAMTGYDREQDRTLALQAGFDAHLAKPIDLASLASLFSSLAG
ncbi:MAG TPA: response regulator [Candidatus Limnocylindria bacterium]|nr:response regulator [Candidatus Limnocylindria bacterium]